MQKYRLLFGAMLITFSLGCSGPYYRSGNHKGIVPASDWNLNLLLFGARGCSGDDDLKKSEVTVKPNENPQLQAEKACRATSWSILHDYESFSDGASLRILGPFLPNLFGYIDLVGETGLVTPAFSWHSGNLDSFCLGPIFCPVLRIDSGEDSYWSCTLCGLIKFGTWGGGLGLLTFGKMQPIYRTRVYAWDGKEFLDLFIHVGGGEH